MYSYDVCVLILVSLWNLDATHEFLESSTDMDMSPQSFGPSFILVLLFTLAKSWTAFAGTGQESGPSDSTVASTPSATGTDQPADLMDLKRYFASIAPEAAQVAPSTPPSAAPPVKRGFFSRWGHAYLEDWAPEYSGAVPGPEPARRGTPAPLNSPPFPSSDWPIGGTPVIGAPDEQTYPLMQAINENKTRFKMYGWVSVGYNASTSNKGKYANAPTAYDVIPNSIQLDQAVLYL